MIHIDKGNNLNILIMGNPESIFIRNLCKNVFCDDNTKVAILTQRYNGNFEDEYRNQGINIVTWPNCFVDGIKRYIFRVSFLINQIKLTAKQIGFGNKIDVVQMHYVEPIHLIYFFPLWRHAQKKILVFWGSDICRINVQSRIILPYFLKQSDILVFMTDNQSILFQSVFGHDYDQKIKVIDFGNSLIDVLDNIDQKCTRLESRDRWKIDSTKICIHIGYNSTKAQQHIKIIDSILALPREVIDRVQLVFHFGYGYNEEYCEYKRSIIEVLDRNRIKYSIIEDFLVDEDLAMFRKTCDIFLYGQTSDARSASPLEYLYAGARVICPGWLEDNYDFLKHEEQCFYVYNGFENLESVIMKCINELPSDNGDEMKICKEKIRERISWDSVKSKWRDLYEQ